ncbi:MAG: hypothetical protein IJ514_05800 [Clostridia bacterium]|nr:hypothetical protein [Clostridia bacterium]
MVTKKQEARAFEYATPSLKILRVEADMITTSGVVAWSDSWGSTFEQNRENTWQGAEE